MPQPSGLGALDLAGQLLDQVGVCLRVDLSLQQTGRTGHGQAGHVLAQLVARAGLFLRCVLPRAVDDALALFQGGRACFVDDLDLALVRLVDDLLGLVAGCR